MYGRTGLMRKQAVSQSFCGADYVSARQGVKNKNKNEER